MKTIKNIVDQNYSETFWPRVGFSFLLEILAILSDRETLEFSTVSPQSFGKKSLKCSQINSSRFLGLCLFEDLPRCKNYAYTMSFDLHLRLLSFNITTMRLCK